MGEGLKRAGAAAARTRLEADLAPKLAAAVKEIADRYGITPEDVVRHTREFLAKAAPTDDDALRCEGGWKIERGVACPICGAVEGDMCGEL